MRTVLSQVLCVFFTIGPAAFAVTVSIDGTYQQSSKFWDLYTDLRDKSNASVLDPSFDGHFGHSESGVAKIRGVISFLDSYKFTLEIGSLARAHLSNPVFPVIQAWVFLGGAAGLSKMFYFEEIRLEVRPEFSGQWGQEQIASRATTDFFDAIKLAPKGDLSSFGPAISMKHQLVPDELSFHGNGRVYISRHDADNLQLWKTKARGGIDGRYFAIKTPLLVGACAGGGNRDLCELPSPERLEEPILDLNQKTLWSEMWAAAVVVESRYSFWTTGKLSAGFLAGRWAFRIIWSPGPAALELSSMAQSFGAFSEITGRDYRVNLKYSF